MTEIFWRSPTLSSPLRRSLTAVQPREAPCLLLRLFPGDSDEKSGSPQHFSHGSRGRLRRGSSFCFSSKASGDCRSTAFGADNHGSFQVRPTQRISLGTFSRLPSKKH